MAQSTAQQIARGLSKRPIGGRKNPRRFANGGAIDEFGNDLTRSNQMGAAAEKMRQDRLSSAAAEPSPVAPTPSIGNPSMRDMNALGTVNPIASGLGAGANYGWSTQSATDKAIAAGLDPRAPNPTYGVSGRMTKQSIADLAPAVSRTPTPNLMQPVDALFPSRRGTAAFADGGEIKETPEQLMERMAKKYGAPSAGTPGKTPAEQPTPAPQPAPPPVPVQKDQGIGGIIGILKGRKEQIDKAVDGYANGGKIKGNGTPTSDSIPAKVRETGEPIAVSTGERIVSHKQDMLLQTIAQGIGFKNLDAMLEAGTGRAVGPTIKQGQRAAANGLAPEEERPYVAPPVSRDPYVLAGKSAAPTATAQPQAIATLSDRGHQATTNPPTVPVRSPVSTSPERMETPARSPVQAIANGIDPDRFVSRAQKSMNLPPVTGENNTGVIARGNQGLQSIATDPTIRENLNAAHASIGDGVSFGTTTGASGKPQTMISGTAPVKAEYLDTEGNPTNDWYKTSRYQQAMGVNARMSNLADTMKRERMERDAYDPAITNPRVRADARQYLADTERRATHQGEVQGRVLENQIKQSKLASDTRLGGLQSAYLAESNPDRKEEIGQQIRGLTGRSPGNAERVTLAQARSNFEIEAARKTVAGLSPEEIRRRTAKQTNTGRENPDFDPTLEHALTLSGRRKVGVDDHFDQKMKQPEAPQYQGNDGDQMTRFRMDPDMKGHNLGKQTEKGYEVLDSAGKHIGYYR